MRSRAPLTSFDRAMSWLVGSLVALWVGSLFGAVLWAVSI